MIADEDKTPFWVHCGKCNHQWAPCFLPITAEAFGKMTHIVCPACGSKKVITGEFPKTTEHGNARAWLKNGDTGTSSLTIWRTLMGETPEDADVPHDPADFGRCYRLLKVMPSWRARLPEVAAKYPAWKRLVEAWDELTALFDEEAPSGTCPKLYARMQALRQADPAVGQRS